MDPIAIIVGQLRQLAYSLFAYLPQTIIALVVLALTWGVARIARFLIGRSLRFAHLRRSLVELLQNLATTAIWIGGVLIAAIIAFPGLTPANFLTAIGLGTIAIGFAFKDVFENFLAGILILLREPFRLGDYIECEDYEGYVEEITIRDTHIRQTDGQRVVMPNARLFTNPVTVRTDQDIRRTTITCGVGYDADVDRAREVIRKAVEGLPSVSPKKPVEIFAQAFGESSIDFEVTWWTGSRPVEIRRSRDEVVASVKRALDGAGIEIPFPYRTLTFKEPLAIRAAEKDGALAGDRLLPPAEAATAPSERLDATARSPGSAAPPG